jgi:hypothetical protein
MLWFGRDVMISAEIAVVLNNDDNLRSINGVVSYAVIDGARCSSAWRDKELCQLVALGWTFGE